MSGQIIGVTTTFSLTLYLVNTFNGNGAITFLNDRVECALFAILCGAGATFCIFSPILFKNLKINEFSKIHLKTMISLSLRFFPAALFFMFMELIDRYLLKFLLDTPNANDLIGAYSVGCKLASVPMLLISAFNLGWQPFYLNNGNTKESIVQYQKVGNMFIIIMLSVSWIVAVIMPLIAQMNIPFVDNYPIIGSNFINGIEIIPFILMSHIFYALYIINMPSIYLCNKQNWSPILRIFGACINVILNIILIPIYGIYGAAIATAAGYGLMFLLLYYKNRNWMPIKLSWGTIFPLTIIIATSIILKSSIIGVFVMIFTFFYIIIIIYKNGLNQLRLLFK
jgi:O-antigen/teichoic acid export membrane protein